MDATFETIGLEVPSEKAINFLAERAENQGEPTRLPRRGAVLHGRCWKLGEGLEVWTVLYESGTGSVFYANCRPGFRARYVQRISPWALTEYDEEGEAVIHGYCDGNDTEVLFELQNLTELGASELRVPALHVALCGLAYRARVCTRELLPRWLPLEKAAPSRAAHENDWSLRGRVLAFKPLRNPLSGSELYWVYVDTGRLKLEVLVNGRSLAGELQIGSMLSAEVWLQGHIIHSQTLRLSYEGVDPRVPIGHFWSHLSRSN